MDKINRKNDRVAKLKLYDGIEGTILERWTSVVSERNKHLGVRMVIRLMDWFGIGIYEIAKEEEKELEEEAKMQKDLLN